MEAFLALGSNLGDRLDTLQRAVDALAQVAGIRVTASSRVWQTAAVGGPPQGAFLNAVIRIDSDLEPRELLAAIHGIEAAQGRTREVRWGPRTIDVDILLIDDRVIDDPDLTIPHPRMRDRAFVVMPLLEIVPDPTLPDGTRLLDVRLPEADVAVFAPPLRITP